VYTRGLGLSVISFQLSGISFQASTRSAHKPRCEDRAHSAESRKPKVESRKLIAETCRCPILAAHDPHRPFREFSGATVDTVRTGAARIKRIIYEPGFRWSKDMKPITGTEQCMHAHVGFLVRGRIHIEYPDGCVREFAAPQAVAIDPGHDGWVIGDEPAVLIEIDFEGDTITKLGMPDAHRH
jgi:hypothetical protein